MIASPEKFLAFARTKQVPEKISVATIHAERQGGRARLVSTSAGFLDSPDCEHILGGINLKAHDYNAVARQGRFLSWGFHGDPSQMTELGRALFLNAIRLHRWLRRGSCRGAADAVVA